MPGLRDDAFDAGGFDPTGFEFEAFVPGSWTEAAFVGGFAVNEEGVLGTAFLDDSTPVPDADARYMSRGLARSAAGLLYVCAWPVSGIVFYEGKIARRADGAMCVSTSGDRVDSCAGWALTFRGEVLAAESTPEVVHGGIGLLETGFVCMSEASLSI